MWTTKTIYVTVITHSSVSKVASEIYKAKANLSWFRKKTCSYLGKRLNMTSLYIVPDTVIVKLRHFKRHDRNSLYMNTAILTTDAGYITRITFIAHTMVRLWLLDSLKINLQLMFPPSYMKSYNCLRFFPLDLYRLSGHVISFGPLSETYFQKQLRNMCHVVHFK